jgi:hypothetical protein
MINILPDKYKSQKKGHYMNTIEKKTKKGMHLNDKHTVSPQKIFNSSSTISANH